MTEPQNKKPRLDNSISTSDASTSTQAPCYLDRLPLELLAEILVYTRSTRDVLSVARCNKSLCYTLLNANSNFIWKDVRVNSICPLPDPCEIFSEAAYAAFVFDGGVCECCNLETKEMFASFALRLRLCTKPDCRKQSVTELLVKFNTTNEDRLKQIPVTENPRCLHPSHAQYMPWSAETKFCRQSDWKNTALDQNIDGLIKRNAIWMEFCIKLYEWKVKRRVIYNQIKSGIEKSAKEYTSANGWNYWDTINCTDFGRLIKHHVYIMEMASIYDMDLIKEATEAQLLALSEKNNRRRREAAYRQNLAAVETHYNRLRSSTDKLILPPFSVFRRLLIIDSLMSVQTDNERTLSNSLKGDPVIKSLLNDQLKVWVDRAKEDLGGILGYPNWKSPNQTLLHPVERPAARFQCSLCKSLAPKYTEDECMDFAGVCTHECPSSKGGKKLRNKEPWRAVQFVKDEKASAAIEKLLELIQMSPIFEDPSLPCWVLCKSCKPPIFLRSESVLGHSHRHNEMRMELFLVPFNSCPVVKGLTQQILKVSKAKKTPTEKFLCSHCLNVHRMKSYDKNEDEVGSNNKTKEQQGGASIKAKEFKPSTFIWDGLRSHLKAKHGILNVRDEDFELEKHEGRLFTYFIV